MSGLALFVFIAVEPVGVAQPTTMCSLMCRRAVSASLQTRCRRPMQLLQRRSQRQPQPLLLVQLQRHRLQPQRRQHLLQRKEMRLRLQHLKPQQNEPSLAS